MGGPTRIRPLAVNRARSVLYGAKFTPVYGTSRGMPGFTGDPFANSSVCYWSHPRALVRGRFSREVYGLSDPALAPEALALSA